MEEPGTNDAKQKPRRPLPGVFLRDSDHYDASEAADKLLRISLLLPRLCVSLMLHAASITSTLVVWGVTRLDPKLPPRTYRRAYQATNRATAHLLLPTLLSGLAIWLLLPAAYRETFTAFLRDVLNMRPLVRFPEPALSAPDSFLSPSPTLAILWMLLLSLPGLVAYAFILQRELSAPFTGVAGFGLAFCTAIPAVLIGIYLPLATLFLAADWLAHHPGGLRILVLFLLGIAAGAFVFCVAGALIVATGLWLFSTTFFRRIHIPYSTLYISGLVALVSHLFVSIAMALLLGGPEALLHKLPALAYLPTLLDQVRAQSSTDLLSILVWLLAAQLPGLLLSGGVVAAIVGHPYRGPLGYLRACIGATLSIWTAILGLFCVLSLTHAVPQAHPVPAVMTSMSVLPSRHAGVVGQ